MDVGRQPAASKTTIIHHLPITKPTEMDIERHIPFAKKACEFLTQSTDPFLAVKTCSDALEAEGFVKLSKREPMAGTLDAGECQTRRYLFKEGLNCTKQNRDSLNLGIS